MYNLQDKTYRNQPPVMSLEVCAVMAERIRRHAVNYGVRRVHIILHGGEPLLLGPKRTRVWVTKVREVLYPDVIATFSMQSNGTLINDEWIDALADLEVGIGLSIDGPKHVNDRYRVYHDGRGSFDDVVAAIRRLQMHHRGREIFGTVMAVVDVNTDPEEVFDLWMELNIPGFDLSLPHSNHLHPPPRGRYSYGDWLIRFFDLWFDRNDPRLRIRFFENILRMIFGCPISADNIGGRPVGVIVVETDGGIEPTDAFKCCEEGITKLNMNVRDNDFDEIFLLPMVRTLQQGRPRLCDTCQACDRVDVCGGGYMPHRFSGQRNFDNPSVYCADLYDLIGHIRGRVIESLPPDLLQSMVGKNNMVVGLEPAH